SSTLGFGFALFATLGVILAAVYLLYMFQKIYLGELDKEENKNLPPLAWQEIAVLVPVLVLIFWIGVQPAVWFNMLDASTSTVVAAVNPFLQQVAHIVPAVAMLP
ncbi:MAG: hypothetical protein WA009_13070, partial [Phototrophicaceae bacterium]